MVKKDFRVNRAAGSGRKQKIPGLKIVGRLAVCLLCLNHSLLLAEVPDRQSAISADGSSTSAQISIGLSTDGGSTFQTGITVGTDAAITATIFTDPDHVGLKGDVFVVQRIGNSFTLKNIDGVFVPWNLSLKSLEPYLESTTLDAEIDVTVFSGEFAQEGSHRIYIGYMPEGGSLIFNPTAGRFEVSAEPGNAFSFFESNIADQIIGARCIVCHVEGGIADGRTVLLYDPDPENSLKNFNTISDFFYNTPDALDYILTKASGGNEHTGGIQLPVGSSDYLALQEFLLLLEGAGGSFIPPDESQDFFDAVVLQDKQRTLRRASLLLAGRLPTDQEKLQVSISNDDTLRSVVRNLMEGENFHEFLVTAANDRLLVRGLGNNPRIIRECIICYPEFSNTLFEYEKLNLEEGMAYPEQALNIQMDKAMIEAPLELIAHVVENELPYSEILTADYQMLNPLLNEMLGGTAVFDDPENKWEFQPGIVDGMWLLDPENLDAEQEEGVVAWLVHDPGELKANIPHAGVLNSRAFLARYPTTATNRNRARSRWTHFHFMDFDIERSAQRTTDPAALADTNNPTLNNPNCTVCHERMDPVAGAFQNYAPQGQYRVALNGTDSLDPFYKYPPDGEETLYQKGDTWYRDMRDPGFGQLKAPSDDNSLQWLAGEIVKDPGFLTAAVKFWWPAIIGSEVLLSPQVVTDADYDARLLAFNAQSKTIEELADAFAGSGMNLKDLLVDLVMSRWFRAESVDAQALSPEMRQAHEIAELGNEKLLTPEQLQRKTTTLTGYTWLNFWNIFGQERDSNAMERLYGLYFGGIDSNGVIKRSRQMSTLMGTVPIVHALEVSCPVVLREFILPDNQRRLFAGITDAVTPMNGESAIRAKLVELHETMLGKTYLADSEEIDAAYTLFVDSWNERRSLEITPNLFNEVDFCPFFYDIYSGRDLPYDGDDIVLETREDGKPTYRMTDEFVQWMVGQGADPNYTKQAWRTVMAYLLSHYDYLYE